MAGCRRRREPGWARRAVVRGQAGPDAAVVRAAPAGAVGSAGGNYRPAVPAARDGWAAAADRELPGSARVRGVADRPGAVAARGLDSAEPAASAGPGKVRTAARREYYRARAAVAAGAWADRDARAAGDRRRVVHRVGDRGPAADARWAVQAAGTPKAGSRAAPPGVVPRAARAGADRAAPRAAPRTADPAGAYRGGRRDADSRAVPGVVRRDAGAVRQVARRTAGSVVVRARGYGCRARGDACSRHSDPPPDVGPARGPGAGQAGRAGAPDRPAARAGAAAVAAPGRIRGRYHAGGRSSPAPIREMEAPAPTVRWGPAGLVDRRAVYRAAADERRIHRRSSCLLYRPDPRLPVVPCVVPNTSPPSLRANELYGAGGMSYPAAHRHPGRARSCRCAHSLHLPCDTRGGHLPRSSGG